MEKYLEVGKIVNTKGLDGTVKVLGLTDDINRFLELEKVYIENNQYKVLRSYVQNNFAYLKLSGITNIEQAERLKEKYILIDREDAVSLNEDEYFITDLLNCEVYLNDGKYLGILTDIDNFGSADIYTVKDKKSEYTFCLVDGLIISVEDNKIILDSEILKEVIV